LAISESGESREIHLLPYIIKYNWPYKFG